MKKTKPKKTHAHIIIPGQVQIKRCVNLSKEYANQAKLIGNGNISSGIRNAIDYYLLKHDKKAIVMRKNT